MSVNSSAIPVRYITGVLDPLPNTTFPKIGCFPAAVKLQTLDTIPVDITATTVAANKSMIRLSSDNYRRELLRVGMYVYVVSQNLVIRIKGVDFWKKSILLEKPFPTDLAAEVVYLAKGMANKEVHVKSSGTADAILQGVPFRVGEDDYFRGSAGVAPIAYNANAGSSEITFNVTR